MLRALVFRESPGISDRQDKRIQQSAGGQHLRTTHLAHAPGFARPFPSEFQQVPPQQLAYGPEFLVRKRVDPVPKSGFVLVLPPILPQPALKEFRYGWR